ncbi:HupE/UreJ family protein [Puniceicoccaceae bacterium K14]|nr:HupE/UreJ family protein [Puniceicoccaceae bacterium K14]
MNKSTAVFTRTALLCLTFLLQAVVQKAYGHTQGENYVFLEFHPETIDGRFEIRYDEIKEKLGVDIFVDGQPSLEALNKTAPQVHQYISENFEIGPDDASAYKIDFTQSTLFNPEGGWAQYHFEIKTGPTPDFLHITHEMCYENDRLHRGVLVIEEGVWPSEGYKMQISMVFSGSNTSQVLDVKNPPEAMTPLTMIWQGMLHIWIGIDHILFLLALALPIVLIKENSKWVGTPKLGASLKSLLKVVTVFTIAHSITLLLASLDIVTLSSRLVESVIALSIILVGVNNVIGRNHNTSLLIILVLGLFHGLGFASVMGELPFRISELKPFILMILGFNLGVEIGQLAILLIVFPLLFALRKTSFYQPIILKGGSILLVVIAGYWFIERAFAL